MSTSPEITAEWTVTAKLRLVRPKENVRHKSVPRTKNETSIKDVSGSKVYHYKWCSDNLNQPITNSFDSSQQVSKSVVFTMYTVTWHWARNFLTISLQWQQDSTLRSVILSVEERFMSFRNK